MLIVDVAILCPIPIPRPDCGIWRRHRRRL